MSEYRISESVGTIIDDSFAKAIKDMSADEKRAYIVGYRAAIKDAQILIRIYEGQSAIDMRVGQAGSGIADIFEGLI